MLFNNVGEANLGVPRDNQTPARNHSGPHVGGMVPFSVTPKTFAPVLPHAPSYTYIYIYVYLYISLNYILINLLNFIDCYLY